MAPGGGDFLRNMLGDLLRLIRTEGPLQWELAFQLATSVAAGDEPDPNPDPIARIRVEGTECDRRAARRDVTGMVLGSAGSGLRLVPTSRVEWARRSLEAWRPLLRPARRRSYFCASGSEPKELRALGANRFRARSHRRRPCSNLMRPTNGPEDGDDEMPVDPFLGEPDRPRRGAAKDDEDTEDLDIAGDGSGRWTSAMAPAMAAMQVGSLVGHLAREVSRAVRPAVATHRFDESLYGFAICTASPRVEPADRRSPALALRARWPFTPFCPARTSQGNSKSSWSPTASSSAPIPATSRVCCKGSTRGASRGSPR